MSTQNEVVPQVGMGVTEQVGSDRYPYTIVQIVSPKHIVIQADEFRRTDTNQQSESQTYEFSPNTEAALIHISKRMNGYWYRVGTNKRGPYWIGNRSAYRDPSF